ncbi:acyltransferase [Lacipirellula sp.]|uniref:acyltransferase n=1 Tax=Lacipirellula sp. TaxID=2691419 RepID=UPI003D0EDB45
MPAELSANQPAVQPAIVVTNSYRLGMVLLGYVPLLHVGTVIGLLVLSQLEGGSPWLAVAAVGVLYLLPPLAVRLIGRSTGPAQPTSHELGSRGFLAWWYATQWQVVFNRLPILEEFLRLVPSLYSAWLRLWGAKIGSLVYWSPGMRVTDRPYLHIGDRVVFGIDSKLYPHFLAKLSSGSTKLILAPINIGSDALVGGCTLLPAGVVVNACEQTPGGRPFAPFTEFRNGSHRRTQRFRKEFE